MVEQRTENPRVRGSIPRRAKFFLPKNMKTESNHRGSPLSKNDTQSFFSAECDEPNFFAPKYENGIEPKFDIRFTKLRFGSPAPFENQTQADFQTES